MFILLAKSSRLSVASGNDGSMLGRNRDDCEQLFCLKRSQIEKENFLSSKDIEELNRSINMYILRLMCKALTSHRKTFLALCNKERNIFCITHA